LIVSEHSQHRVAARMANHVVCREVRFSSVYFWMSRCWTWSLFSLFVVSFFPCVSLSPFIFYLNFKPFLSRNEHGGVRQAQHSKTFHHRQWSVAANRRQKVNEWRMAKL
jgi:hypothetical protein